MSIGILHCQCGRPGAFSSTWYACCCYCVFNCFLLLFLWWAICRRDFLKSRLLPRVKLYSLFLTLSFYVPSNTGGRPFHVTLDVALISYTSKPMAPIEFSLPDTSSFPLMDVDFAAPLRCFSVENVLLLFALMLKECKLLFVCESNTMLTECMETMRALLFPLDWSSCFVPRLPNALLGELFLFYCA